MPLPFTREQLNNMSDEQLMTLKGKLQQHSASFDAPVKPKFNVAGSVMGALKGLTTGQIPEPAKPKEDVATKVNNMIAMEKAKRELLPPTVQDQAAQLSLDDKKREDAYQVKLRAEEEAANQQASNPSVPSTIPDSSPGKVITKPTPNTALGSEPPKIEYRKTYTHTADGKLIVKDEATEESKAKLELWQKQQEEINKNAEGNQKEAEEARSSAQDVLDTISKVENGIKYFGAAGGIPPAPWEYNKKLWKAELGKLTSGLVINKMLEMKKSSKTGATGFGQLSEKELMVLKQASTELNETLSPDQAQVILNKMREKLQKIAQQAPTEQPLSGKVSSGLTYTIEE